jgi:hypothetical protein
MGCSGGRRGAVRTGSVFAGLLVTWPRAEATFLHWYVAGCPMRGEERVVRQEELERKNVLPAQTLNGSRHFDFKVLFVLNCCKAFDVRAF